LRQVKCCLLLSPPPPPLPLAVPSVCRTCAGWFSAVPVPRHSRHRRYFPAQTTKKKKNTKHNIHLRTLLHSQTVNMAAIFSGCSPSHFFACIYGSKNRFLMCFFSLSCCLKEIWKKEVVVAELIILHWRKEGQPIICSYGPAL
jgi:hypothetical protein